MRLDVVVNEIRSVFPSRRGRHSCSIIMYCWVAYPSLRRRLRVGECLLRRTLLASGAIPGTCRTQKKVGLKLTQLVWYLAIEGSAMVQSYSAYI